MKIIEFSLFSVLMFKGLRNNKPDKVFWKAPQLFLWKKKLAKRTSRPLSLPFFRDPCGLKNRRGSFFLIKSGSRKRTKKETLEKNKLQKTGNKNPWRRRMRWLLI